MFQTTNHFDPSRFGKFTPKYEDRNSSSSNVCLRYSRYSQGDMKNKRRILPITAGIDMYQNWIHSKWDASWMVGSLLWIVYRHCEMEHIGGFTVYIVTPKQMEKSLITVLGVCLFTVSSISLWEFIHIQWNLTTGKVNLIWIIFQPPKLMGQVKSCR